MEYKFFFQRRGKVKTKIKEYLIGVLSVPKEQKFKKSK